MKLKDTPLLEEVRLFVDNEKFNFFTLPYNLKKSEAIQRYGEREVLYVTDYDDIGVTEVIVESDEQFKKRTEN